MSAPYSVKCGMQALSLSFLIAWVDEQTEQLETGPFLPASSSGHKTVEDNSVLSPVPLREFSGVLGSLGQRGYHPLLVPSLLP